MTLNRSKKILLIGLADRATVGLAIELKRLGHSVTGTFDEVTGHEKDKLLKDSTINELSASDKIDEGTEAVVIGPGIPKDHLKVRQAQAAGLPLYSVPDFIYELSSDKQRLVVTGNHGKTLITALIIHVLQFSNRKFDFFTANKPNGFDGVVKLSDAPIIVIEGQDVSASNLDPSPSFLKYHHHIGVINGIEWQASTQYPTR
ncbi:MAG TPA: hypothetical protein VG737_18510, partial [Cyclobacteriaceae bacterium]|nr:hypothetical protein [Cyclobacteriaceae bacterium]